MKKLKYFIITVLLTLNILLIYKLKSQREVFISINSLINKRLNNDKDNLMTFKNNFINERINDNLELGSNIEFIDIEGNKFLAKDLFKKNSLVLRYSELNCNDCIEAEIDVLLKNKEKLTSPIFFLAYYQNKRDLFVYYKKFKKKGLKNIKMYLLSDKGLNIPADKLNMPYYFCIDKTLRMNNFFIPQKNKQILSESYLITTSKNFLSNAAL